MKEGREINGMAEMRLLSLSLEGRSRKTRTKQGFTSNPFILNVLGLFCSKVYLLSCPDSPRYNYSYLRGCWIIHSSELILQINLSLLLNIAVYKNIKLSSHKGHMRDTMRLLIGNIFAALLPIPVLFTPTFTKTTIHMTLQAKEEGWICSCCCMENP